MFRGTPRPLATASNGFVCLSCHYRLLESQNVNIRRQIQTATTTPGDSWFDAINEISEEFRTVEQVKRKGKTSKLPKQGPIEQRNNDKKSIQASSEKGGSDSKTSQSHKAGFKPSSQAKTPASKARPLTVAERVREAKERAKWGGMDATKPMSLARKSRPSHDSLRRADKVSPQTMIESASSKRPYGFQPMGTKESKPTTDEHVLTKKEVVVRTWKKIREQRKAKRLAESKSSTLESDGGSLESNPQTLRETSKEKPTTKKEKKTPKQASSTQPQPGPTSMEIETIDAGNLKVRSLDIHQPPVPYLEYGLDKVLFNPGIHQLQDPTSRVYNFDPYLQKVMPVDEFDFGALKQYKTSSEDAALGMLAQEHDKKYIGSTSSMTGVLSHFHFLLSAFRPINTTMLSKGFVGKTLSANFTQLTQAPSAIFLRWKDGHYAIDADKEFDSGNVLMLLGKSLELLLTLPRSDYERYRKSDPRQVSEEQKTAPESYQYSTMGDFLMRSQLDAYDPRLPDNGTFDLKTRAVVSVRMDAQNYEPMTGYELSALRGKWGSYEREYYDMMRSTMLKYMLQARMGRMNGIFVAYHNVKRIFGFQYVPMRDMDLALHDQTDPALGDQEFRVSLDLLNKFLNKATAKFPETSLRIHFETRQESGADSPLTSLHVFAEPMTEDEVASIQNKNKAKIEEFERKAMGFVKQGLDNEDGGDGRNEGESAEEEFRVGKPLSASEMIGSSLEAALKQAKAPVTAPVVTASDSTEELKPLFYASVLIKSKVNDEYIREDRPANLTDTDRWEVEYLMQEYEVTRQEWAAYEDMKARRREALNFDEDDENQKSDYYIQFLRSLAAKGQKLRSRIDSLEAGKDVVIVDKPLSRVRETVEGVDDYLRLLYNNVY